MSYQFDEIVDRKNTDSVNVDGFRKSVLHVEEDTPLPYKDGEFVRMWIADMEFATAPEVCQAMTERVGRRIFGYTKVYGDRFYRAFSQWCRDLYDWSFPQRELVISQGVVPALHQLLEMLVEKGEKVLTFTPAYSQFKHAADYCGVELVPVPLEKEEGRYEIDFEELERRAAEPGVKMMILCNPHNPTGRVWTWEELERIAGIVEQHGLWLISDEIHCDLLRQGKRHIPMGKVMPEYQKLVTCMSASKTFNLAGLMFADVIIRDEAVRERYVALDKALGIVNPISLAAHRAAYEKGRPWLEELKKYLDQNFLFARKRLDQRLPKLQFQIPEATYLAWVDFSPYLSDVEDIVRFFADEAGVLLEAGDGQFVGNAACHVRLNLAMPRSMVEEGIERICAAVERHAGLAE